MSQVCKAIETYHTSIADYFYRRAGMEAMHLESNIMVDILIQLQDMGVVALPVRDAVVVREDQASEVKNVMLTVLQQHTGLDGLVTSE